MAFKYVPKDPALAAFQKPAAAPTQPPLPPAPAPRPAKPPPAAPEPHAAGKKIKAFTESEFELLGVGREPG
jgi:hypothetical protein